MTTESLRSLLRRLSVLSGSAPEFDPARAPADPMTLFTGWLLHAVDAGIAEPHAMTVSTVTARDRPSARVLILKDVDDVGWHVAVSSVSRKGAELSGSPGEGRGYRGPRPARGGGR